MDKLKMHTPNRANENLCKRCELFPIAVTEALNETGEIVSAIDNGHANAEDRPQGILED